MIAYSVRQRQYNDCGVAALAMALMIPYELVWGAMEAATDGLRWSGLSLASLEKMALHLTWRLERQRPGSWDPHDGASGVIKVLWTRHPHRGHYVATRGGLVLGTSGAIYLPEEYPLWRDARYATRLVIAGRALSPEGADHVD